MTDQERACLAIADISGYTSYLADVELDHAQDILSDLTVTVVEALAPFQLLKLEGDAAFVYSPGDEFDSSLLQDTVEGTYLAFRRRLRDIKQAYLKQYMDWRPPGSYSSYASIPTPHGDTIEVYTVTRLMDVRHGAR